jgi:hypothetical protein
MILIISLWLVIVFLGSLALVYLDGYTRAKKKIASFRKVMRVMYEFQFYVYTKSNMYRDLCTCGKGDRVFHKENCRTLELDKAKKEAENKVIKLMLKI